MNRADPDGPGARRLLEYVLERDDNVRDTPVIPGFDCEEFLGEGGGGVVYKGRRRGSDHTVAIKLLRISTSDQYIDRVWREIRSLAAMHLHCVPNLVDHGVAGDRPYIVTDFIAGRSPIDYADSLSLSASDRVGLLTRIANAVQSLHERGVIHRDIKPSNILIDTNGDPIIIDLGMALGVTDDQLTLTAEGTPIGTPTHMAPEQARGERRLFSTRTDVYQLGVIGYQLLVGALPHDFEGLSLAEAIQCRAYQPAHRPVELAPGFPRPLSAVLEKAVSMKPDDRYPSAGEFAVDLVRWTRREPPEAMTPDRWQRLIRMAHRHPIHVTTIACASTVMTSLLGILLGYYVAAKRPARLIISDDRAVVMLKSVADVVLERWDSGWYNGVAGADIVDGPDGRQLLIAFKDHVDEALHGQLCAFKLEPPYELAWTRGTRAELAMPHRISGAANRPPQEFRVYHIVIADVFANPGPEIIVTHKINNHSQHAVVIYSLDGESLFSLWHDGQIIDIFWLPEARRLLIAGVNSERDDIRHPNVVFAVDPVLGEHHEWIRAPGGAGTFDPAWYKLICPAESAKDFKMVGISEHTSVGANMGDTPRIDVEHVPSKTAFRWLIDVEGNVVETDLTSLYELAFEEGRAPDPSILQIGDCELPVPEKN